MTARPALIALVDEIGRTRGRLRSAFQPVEAALALSETEMTVLNAVVGASSPPTVPQIGRSLGHPRQVIQRAANALAERGFIVFADNPHHQRASLLHATDAGLTAKGDADALGQAVARGLSAGIDPDLIRSVAEGLHVIRLAIEANVKSATQRSAS